MIAIGADTNDATHMLVAVDGATGQVHGEREIPADESWHLDALRRAHDPDAELSGRSRTAGMSRHLGRALMHAGEHAHFARMAGVAPIPPAPAHTTATGYTAAATANSTTHYTSSPSPEHDATQRRAPTSNASPPKARATERPSPCLKRS
jgi:hypothetical protein